MPKALICLTWLLAPLRGAATPTGRLVHTLPLRRLRIRIAAATVVDAIRWRALRDGARVKVSGRFGPRLGMKDASDAVAAVCG